jgi:hypothetical protein
VVVSETFQERRRNGEKRIGRGGGGKGGGGKREELMGRIVLAFSAEKNREVLSLGEETDFDRVDFIDRVSADTESVRGSFRDEDFRLYGDNDRKFSGFVIHVFV